MATGNLPTKQRFMYPCICSETRRLGPRHSAQVINIQTLNVELINEDALRFKGISSREFTRTSQIPEGFERHSPFVAGFYLRPLRLRTIDVQHDAYMKFIFRKSVGKLRKLRGANDA